MKKITVFSWVFVAILIVNLGILYFFSHRDIVYDVSFSPTQDHEKVEVEGIIKKYTLKQDAEGKVYEVENYVMERDEIEIAVKVPENIQDYTNIRVEAEFQNPNNPTLEIGVKKVVDYNLGEPMYNYDYNFLDNQYLNQFKQYFAAGASYLEDQNSGIILFQREKVYNDISEFFDNPPQTKEEVFTETDEFGFEKLSTRETAQIATVDYALEQKFNFQEFAEESSDSDIFATGFSRIPYSFRGSSDFYVFVETEKQDDLEINFLKQDLNSTDGEDVVEVKVWNYQDELIYYRVVNDDGIDDQSGVINIQRYQMNVPVEVSGLYKIEFISRSASNDFTIRNLEVNSSKVLMNDINVVDNSETAKNMITKPFSVFAPKGNINVRIIGRQFDQNVFVNETPYTFSWEKNTRRQNIRLPESLNKLLSSVNGLILEGSHPFALQQETLFHIFPNMTEPLKLQNMKNINFIVAKYAFPEIKNNIAHASTSFSLENIHRNETDSTIQMRIRAIGIEGYGNTVTLKNIRIILQK